MKDKVVIITGAARGLGQKYAIEFAKIGAKIVFADINSCSDTENKIKKLTDKLKIKEYGILSRAGFSYSLCKKVLNELNLEEIDSINNER